MIRVRYFAALADKAGCREESWQEGAGRSLEEMWQEIRRRHAFPETGILLAVNQRYVPRETLLAEGDEVAVIPPVSGGQELPVLLTREPIRVDPLVAEVSHGGAGGLVLFLGVARNQSGGRPTRGLLYEAYEDMALSEMALLHQEVLRQFPEVRLAMMHRLGSLEIGETAVAIAASAPHRAEAFAACRMAIDRLKQTVPIWKKEFWLDGGEEWR